MVEAFEEVVGEEPREGLGESGVGDAVDVDVDGFEDGLVESPPGLFVGSGIGGAEVFGEPEGGLEVAFDGFPVDFGGCEGCSGIGDLLGDAGLVLFEEVEIDGTGGVGLEQLAAFGFEVGDALAGCSCSLVCSAGDALHAGDESFVDATDGAVGEFDGAVVSLDGVFDGVDSDAREVAVVAFLMSSEAEEVLVLPTASSGLGVDEAALTSGAVDGAAQVVVVGALLLGALAVRVEHGLDLGEGVDVDERFVSAVVLGTAPGDEPDVERVVQDRVDVPVGERLRRSFQRRAGGEAFGFERLRTKCSYAGPLGSGCTAVASIDIAIVDCSGQGSDHSCIWSVVGVGWEVVTLSFRAPVSLIVDGVELAVMILPGLVTAMDVGPPVEPVRCKPGRVTATWPAEMRGPDCAG